MFRDYLLSTVAAGGQLMVSPEAFEQFEAHLTALANHKDAAQIFESSFAAFSARDDYWPQDGAWDSAYKPYVVKEGILQIPVKGVLLNNFPYAAGSYATGYKYIEKALERGLADDNVKGIALVCDTPGGMVAGCFELADKIYSARGEKPIAAFAHEAALSAGYALASAASRITVSRTGLLGSIGVVTTHADRSKQLENAGIALTFIHAGKHKVDGNEANPLSADAKKRIQSRIDETYGLFVSAVARNRKIDEKAVRGQDALIYGSREAMEQKLADRVGPFDDAITEFSVALLGDHEEEDDMAIDQKTHDEAVAKAKADGIAEATAASAAAATTAATAAKTRIKDIRALDEAKGRPAAAESVAFNTDMSVADAKTFLATLPEEKTAAAPTTNAGNPAFEKKMNEQAAGPGAGDGAEGEGGGQELSAEAQDAAAVERIVGARFGAKK